MAGLVEKDFRLIWCNKQVKMSSKNYNFYCIYFSTIFAEVK